MKRGFFPLDRRLRLRRDSWSEGVVRGVAWLGTTQPSFEVAAETLSRLTGLWMSDTTLWRCHGEVAEQIESELRREEQDIQTPVYAGEEPKASEPIAGHASVSLDGTTIRIREEGYREVKIVSVSEVVVQPERTVAASGGPPVGRIADREAVRGRQDGVKLVGHSYRAVLGDKTAFEAALAAELARRGIAATDKVTTVNDGADWIWDLVERYLPDKRTEILDWPHAIQNLCKAGEAAWGVESQTARVWLTARETELWQGRVMDVRTALEQLPQRRKERGKAIRRVKDYIAGHQTRLDYQRFRDEGRPIGSGTVESAAKNVIAWRMKRGGQSWERSGATRMLAALGEVHSSHWDQTCRRLAKAA